MSVDILILGAGWTSTFLIPLCNQHGLSQAATSRSGRDGSIKFEFNPNSDDEGPYKVLPDAKTVLITFPIAKSGASERLVKLYESTRTNSQSTAFVQLGSTGIWDGHKKAKSSNDSHSIPQPPGLAPSKWYNRHSPYLQNDRVAAEEELLQISSSSHPTTVLNLAGLWGGTRSMRNWVGKVAPTKEVLKNKGSIHMIHGIDVARAILAVHNNFDKAAGQRWILTDERVYDWWDLASAWGSKSTTSTQEDDPEDGDSKYGPQPRWVRELMEEQNVRALPRDIEMLGRALDSREFWTTFDLSPVKARLEGD